MNPYPFFAILKPQALRRGARLCGQVLAFALKMPARISLLRFATLPQKCLRITCYALQPHTPNALLVPEFHIKASCLLLYV